MRDSLKNTNSMKGLNDKKNLNNYNKNNSKLKVNNDSLSHMNSTMNIIQEKKNLQKRTSETLNNHEKNLYENLGKIDKPKNFGFGEMDSLEVKSGSSYMKSTKNKESSEHEKVIDPHGPPTNNNSTRSNHLAMNENNNYKSSSIYDSQRNLEENKGIPIKSKESEKESANNVTNNPATINTNNNIFVEEEEKKEIKKVDNLKKQQSQNDLNINNLNNINNSKKDNNSIINNLNNLKIKNNNKESEENNNTTNTNNNNLTNNNNNIIKGKDGKATTTILSTNDTGNLSIYMQNPQIPEEYLADIHKSLSSEEANIPSVFGYMKNHTDINEQMRAILIDWIIEVHSKFNLQEETLFLCVNIIDRYLKSETIQRSKLQLLGVSSIMIACKQEEIYSPSIRDFVFITDNAYSKQEIFDKEYHILKVLEFNTVFPSSLRFYELIALEFKFESKHFNFGLYLLQLYLIDYRMTKYIPSVIACTAAYIVMKFFKLPNYTKIYTDWNKNTNSSSLIKDCAREICFLVDNINGSSLKATKKKFSQDKYDAVSLINFI